MTIKSQLQERNVKDIDDMVYDEHGNHNLTEQGIKRVKLMSSQTIDTLCDEIGKRLPEQEHHYNTSGVFMDLIDRAKVLQLLEDIKQEKL